MCSKHRNQSARRGPGIHGRYDSSWPAGVGVRAFGSRLGGSPAELQSADARAERDRRKPRSKLGNGDAEIRLQSEKEGWLPSEGPHMASPFAEAEGSLAAVEDGRHDIRPHFAS